MRLTGSFGVMSITDLLQWIMTAGKTGCLRVQRRSVSRSIFSRDGKVIACSSADPLVLLGQFLMHHGWIPEDTLKEALRAQEETQENLGKILVEMGAVTQVQLLQVIASKAMETIHGLFDWEEATFEFVADVQPTPDTIEVDLGIQEILLEGVRRQDEMKAIRAVFHSADVVPTTTEMRPDAPTLASPMARRIYEAIDGTKTLSEVMLACRASEFRVCQFLLRLHECGFVAVKEQEEEPAPPVEAAASVEPAPPVDDTASVERARELIQRGETLAAFDLLRALSNDHPGDPAIKSLLSDVETTMIQDLYLGELPPDAVPVACANAEAELTGMLSAEERYLLELVDGERDIKSIVWVAPMTLAEILRSLKMLSDRELIRAGTSDHAGIG